MITQDGRALLVGSLAVVDATAAAASSVSKMQTRLMARSPLGTQLKSEWAHRCLAENEFDYDQAMRAFLSLRAQIPSDAFMN